MKDTMTMPRALRHVVAVMLMLAANAPTDTRAATGLVAIEAKELLKVRGCGKDKGRPSVQLSLEANDRWSLALGATTWGGTYEPTGRSGRKLALSLSDDAPLLAYLSARVDALCGEPVSELAVTPRKLLAVLNKRETKVKLVVVERLASPRTGKYRVTGKGSLGPLPSTTLPPSTTSTSVTSTTTITTLPSTSTTLESTTTTLTSTTTTTTTSTTTTSTSVSTSTSQTTSTTSSTSTTLISGCLFDTGLTIIDVCSDLEWEKKDGADGEPGSGSQSLANPHDVDNIYYWVACARSAARSVSRMLPPRPRAAPGASARCGDAPSVVLARARAA